MVLEKFKVRRVFIMKRFLISTLKSILRSFGMFFLTVAFLAVFHGIMGLFFNPAELNMEMKIIYMIGLIVVFFVGLKLANIIVEAIIKYLLDDNF